MTPLRLTDWRSPRRSAGECTACLFATNIPLRRQGGRGKGGARGFSSRVAIFVPKGLKSAAYVDIINLMVELRLIQRPELRQILTPKLIQTLKLLLLPKVELEAQLQQELMENPMLEVTSREQEQNPAEVEEGIREWRKLLDGLRLTSVQLEEREPDAEHPDPLTFTRYEKTLYESLSEQLAVAAPNERIKAIGDFIIGSLDDRGFLPLSVEEIARELARLGEIDPPPSPEEVEKALRVVQSLSPPGIAARDIRESFLIQLRDLGLEDSLAYIIVRDHFSNLLRKNVIQLADSLGVSEEEVEHALEVLSHLTLFPAEGRGVTATAVEPDLIVYKDESGRWQIIYNDENIPELTINKHYLKLLRSSEDLNPEAKKFLLQKLESARWWIDALRQRRETLVATMRAILKFQRDFFEEGPENIKPLTMETVANEVGVHPATISRVVRDKYVLTPYGTFPMRRFFTTGIAAKGGGQVATEAVKRRIREIIDSEDKSKPYSDQKIAEILQSEGIQIARRTVAKYREQMGILPARRRKR